jgi:trehalose/maltose hydrolase-like predicted phosphorylase
MSLLLLNARLLGCSLSKRFNCLSFLSSLPSTPTRHLHNDKNHDGVITSGMSLCQVNNHPDFRLRVAKQKLSRTKVMVAKQTTTASNNRAKFSSKSIPNYKKEVREGGLNIHVMENPVRSNDGTSSGALVNDRLRMARRKMIEKLKTPVEIKEEIKKEVAKTEQSHSSEQDKRAQEKFWMDMWKDAGNEIKRLRGELQGESDKDAIADIQADIKGLRKRKAEFAKLLRMDE